MNIATRLNAQSNWEVAKDAHYTMRQSDFVSGVVVTDAASGREMICGETKLGVHMTTILNVPLCDGCDAPIPSDGCCHNCEVIHADIADAGKGVWL